MPGRTGREADLRPYIEATLEAFGPERTIYAGDYPILLQATTLTEWVDVLDRGLRRSRAERGRDPQDLPRQRHQLLPAADSEGGLGAGGKESRPSRRGSADAFAELIDAAAPTADAARFRRAGASTVARSPSRSPTASWR